MNFSCMKVAAFVGVLLTAVPAFAQASVEPFVEDQVILTSAEAPVDVCMSAKPDLSCYGIVEFDDPKDMYQQLTAPGRCPKGETAAEAEPCAFVYYERTSGEGGDSQFKPIFKVESKDKIWAIHGKKLQQVSIEELYGDNVTVRGMNANFTSFAVVGNAENAENCANNRPCLARLVKEDIFKAYLKLIPGFVIDKLWHNRRDDPGVKITKSGRY